MGEFTRSYGAGRAVVGLAALAGWCAAAVGLVVAAAGALSFLGADDRLLAVAQLGTLSAGLGLAVLGIVAVAAAQHMRATFDIADMTREMLSLARRRSDPPEAPAARERPVLPPLTGGAKAPARDAAGPTLSARPRDVGAKVHPIFSARPPR